MAQELLLNLGTLCRYRVSMPPKVQAKMIKRTPSTPVDVVNDAVLLTPDTDDDVPVAAMVQKRPAADTDDAPRGKAAHVDDVADVDAKKAAVTPADSHGVRTPPAIRKFLDGHEAWGNNQVQSLADWVKTHQKVDPGSNIQEAFKALKGPKSKAEFSSKLALCTTSSELRAFEEDFREVRTEDTMIVSDDLTMYDVWAYKNIPMNAPDAHKALALAQCDRVADVSKPDGFRYAMVHVKAREIKDSRVRKVGAKGQSISTADEYADMKSLMDTDKHESVANFHRAGASSSSNPIVTVGPSGAKGKAKARAKAKARVNTEKSFDVDSMPMSDVEKNKTHSEIAKAATIKRAESLVAQMSNIMLGTDRFDNAHNQELKAVMPAVVKAYKDQKLLVKTLNQSLNLQIAEFKREPAGSAGPADLVSSTQATLTAFKKSKKNVETCIAMMT